MNPETGAVVHCHPLHCTTLAVRNEPVKCNITPEGVLLLGSVPMVKYYTPGSQELVDAIAEVGHSKARGGALSQGRTLEEAYNRMEELEFQARLQLLAGDVKDLPKKEIAKLSKM